MTSAESSTSKGSKPNYAAWIRAILAILGFLGVTFVDILGLPAWSFVLVGVGCLLWASFDLGRFRGERDKNPILVHSVAKTSSQKHRVAVLLPFSDRAEYVEKDWGLALDGFQSALAKEARSLSAIDIRFCDHGNNPAIAEKVINECLNEGYQYFISTMSQVCKPLSESFDQIVKAHGSQKAILLCTVAASPHIKTTPNSVYRFFVNALDEANVLFDWMSTRYKSVAVVRFDVSSYGENVSKQFIKRWHDERGIVVEEVKLREVKQEEIFDRIQRSKEVLIGKEAILVVAYCAAYQDILQAIVQNGINSHIATTSTFSFSKIDESHQILLSGLNVVSCFPVKKNTAFYGNVANYFAYASLRRLCRTLLRSNYRIEDFHTHWSAELRPEGMKDSLLSSSKSEDPSIKLTVSRLKTRMIQGVELDLTPEVQN